MVYLRRGTAYKLKNDKDRAIADLKKAVELNVDPAIRVPAGKALGELGYTDPPPTGEQSAPQVFFIINEQDSAILKKLSDILVSKGFNVQNVEQNDMEGVRGVRYYYPEDKENAEKIRKIVSDAIAAEPDLFKWNIPRIYLSKSYRAVPRGSIDVWLPESRRGIRK
ncbi:MAG TPA: tetratricopeptide repeat protein, partial [Blastocatellia bacterium]|nr:tetratricopeptide repeat protein [Blastocatellia bacterium]